MNKFWKKLRKKKTAKKSVSIIHLRCKYNCTREDGLWFCCYVFTLWAMHINGFIWISSIGNIIIRYYNESLPDNKFQRETTLDWLSMVYMIVYIPLNFVQLPMPFLMLLGPGWKSHAFLLIDFLFLCSPKQFVQLHRFLLWVFLLG